MEHMNMGRWLKGVAIATGIIGALGFFVVLPVYSQIICRRVPEFAPAALPWLIFFWVMAVPCYLALYQFWRICCEIGRDNSFMWKMCVRCGKLRRWHWWTAESVWRATCCLLCWATARHLCFCSSCSSSLSAR
ncbi:MAG: DUF2975 domain-containing protein [Clostridia bacterium]|nr:DUF2975 domain-containing protein [Clostridia bacterium]